MKRFNVIALVGLLAALMLAPLATAQVVSLNSTTISAALAAADRVVCLTSYTYVKTPTTAQQGSLIYVGSEAMTVLAAGSTTGCYQVLRNNKPAAWASGTAVYYRDASNFYTTDPPSGGACTTASMSVRPWVNMTNRVVWDCVSSKWTAINGYPSYGLGLTALGPVTAGTVDVGSAALPFRYLYFAGGSGTPGTNNFQITGTSTSGTRVFTLPNFNGTAATLAGTETLTNKTITAAVVTDTAVSTAQFDAVTGTTGTTLTNVTGLSRTVVAGTYRFYINLPGTATSNSGIKAGFKFTTTALTSLEATARAFTASGVVVQHVTSTADQASLIASTTATISTVIEGTMVVATGGTIQLQAAQNAAHADTTSVYVGASMTFTRIQ